MDLSKGGLAGTPRPKSKSTASNSRSRRSSSPVSRVSRPDSTSSSTSTRSMKRKSEAILNDGDESEMGNDQFNKKPKSKIASLQVRSNAFKPQMHTATSSVRNSNEDDEENERDEMPPPSRFHSSSHSRLYKQHTQNATFEHTFSYDMTSHPSHNTIHDAYYDKPRDDFDPLPSNAAQQQQNDIVIEDTQESAPEHWGTQDESDGIRRVTFVEEGDEEQKSNTYDESSDHVINEEESQRMDQQASSSSSPLLDLYAPQNEDLDDKNDTPEHTSPVANERRSKSPELSAEAREAQAIEQLNSVSTLFPGPNPFLQYAKALARSKGRLTNEGSGMTTDELIEKSRNNGVELSNRLSGILEKTNNLFCRIGARQAGVRAKLEAHSEKLAEEDKQIEETKKRLGDWSGQLLKEGGKDST